MHLIKKTDSTDQSDCLSKFIQTLLIFMEKIIYQYDPTVCSLQCTVYSIFCLLFLPLLLEETHQIKRPKVIIFLEYLKDVKVCVFHYKFVYILRQMNSK